MVWNTVDIEYEQTGSSTTSNNMGMREMQIRAYEKRNSEHLIIKAPPASGKSRALMFIALDKLYNQGIKKVIVAVPERSIGASFKNTDLVSHGFFADWKVKDEYNLTTVGGEGGKVNKFKQFMASNEQIIVCTHSTLRFAFEQLDDSEFDDCLLAIDEFHHVSADINSSRLGELLKSIMNNSNCQILAMTGSYFRGDTVPILSPEDEEKFDKVTYTYYEQLNGYKYLKSFGIGYHFYQGVYLSAIDEVLDTNKKTIIHIPNVNSLESTKEKENEVDAILDIIGEFQYQDSETGINFVKSHQDGNVLKIADLVTENGRDRVDKYLSEMTELEDLDIIIALNKAKEGFDWPYCEHALTIGTRGSLTEIVQIIGRATRDSYNKNQAQFTNLIAQPEARDDDVTYAVNTMLKAISASLLMEQVLTPDFKFKRRRSPDEKNDGADIYIRGLKEPSTERSKQIIENDLYDLKAAIFQDDSVLKSMADQDTSPEVTNKVLIPKIIQEKYPDLSNDEIEEVRQAVVANNALTNSRQEEAGNTQFVRMAERIISVEDLSIDLIDKINPFQKAFEVISRELDAPTLKLIRETIDANKIHFDEAEIVYIWPKVEEFFHEYGRVPDIKSDNELEKRMGEAVVFMRNKVREQESDESIS
ncbi:DEAD/DEAH box helicase family protein [Vagococcus lutrae]|uniref:DEAD/DEAH box helicase n=1 Tax=Vagococcus lutrae TaxID=81947 RepID=UPI00288FF21A|nr:DEAD/DEAH box helicase family protein [Vagococcus lutrae]MDT2801817.1 DEAD/DEAH box helicase family protein [Vagococcus lutrae]